MSESDPIAHIRHLSVIEQIKYSFARYCWLHRNESVRHEGIDKPWPARFEECWHQSLWEYIDQCKTVSRNDSSGAI